jgi:hypothetical protein
MANVHHAPDDMAPRRNWRTLWIVLAIIVAVAIVYSVASAVSQSRPSDTAVVPPDQPVTGGVTTRGGMVDTPTGAVPVPAEPDEAPLAGPTVTDGAGTGTVIDATTGATDNGVAQGTRRTPVDQ